jgi:hypothetical protein
MSIFLDDDDVAKLTGKKLKAGQIDALRRMGILFYVNAAGRPVVPISSVDPHNHAAAPIDKPWTPNVLRHGQKANI